MAEAMQHYLLKWTCLPTFTQMELSQVEIMTPQGMHMKKPDGTTVCEIKLDAREGR